MLTLTIRGPEQFNNETSKFVEGAVAATLELEHSLFSLAKWESKWKKSFLDTPDKTQEQTIDYVRTMVLTPNISSETFDMLTQEHYDLVAEYVKTDQTATWFTENGKNGNRPAKKEITTAEIIFHWMIALNIPFECQHWNLGRLMALIRVANEKNTPEKHRKKMSRTDAAAQRRAINEQRRAKMGSRG